MIIRKLFKFECAHTVPGAYSTRCSRNVHGHSYELELSFSKRSFNPNENAGMLLDFGYVKDELAPLIDMWDHAWAFGSTESQDYIKFVKENNERWVQLPFNTTAEVMSLFFGKASMLWLIYRVNPNQKFDSNLYNNKRFIDPNTLLSTPTLDTEVQLNYSRVHETRTGYAESSREAFTFPAEEWKFSEKLWQELPEQTKKFMKTMRLNGDYE